MRLYIDNLKRYWKEHIVHVSVGAFAGLLLTSLEHPWAGGVIMATVLGRQALEFQKRNDTPGIDLSYHLGGLVLGIVFGLLGWSLPQASG